MLRINEVESDALDKNMYHYAHKKINEIDDPDLNAFFDEIALSRSISKDGLVVQFLIQALHPFGLPKIRKFSKLEFIPGSILRRKVGSLAKTEIYKLCMDLVVISKKHHIENLNGNELYSLINKTLPDNKKLQKSKK